MSPLERARRWVVGAVAVWSGSVVAYYAYQEVTRRRVISRRKRRHRQQLAACDAQGSAALAADRERFASLVIGGRFNNPFSEWREQGAWEWSVESRASSLISAGSSTSSFSSR